MLGIGRDLVEFDYENMKIMKNAKTKNLVMHILKINDETFLIFDDYMSLELISKKDLACLNSLKLSESIY